MGSQHLPYRPATQSPGVQQQRDRIAPVRSIPLPVQESYLQYHPTQLTRTMTQLDRAGTPGSIDARMMDPSSRTATPPTPMSAHLQPTQLKVKVNCDSGNYITLVVQYNITYQTLIQRIDNKLSRFTSSSIDKGNLRLRYRDEDGDFVSIESDDDIQIAIDVWREGVRSQYTMSGGVGEIELFCVGEIN